jgi:pentose-5-phosphate-3-epimerase
MGKHPAPTRSPDPAEVADRVKLSDRRADLIHVDVMHVHTVPPRSA